MRLVNHFLQILENILFSVFCADSVFTSCTISIANKLPGVKKGYKIVT